jgi:hypothetical protein
MLGVSFTEAIKVVMKVGGLDLLCVLPKGKIETYGIPYVCAKVEKGQTVETIGLWEKLWVYFDRQWMGIVDSWNICSKNREYTEMVNFTNNALESYNKRFNSLFPKKPTLMEFVQIVEQESRFQAEQYIKLRTACRS